MSVHMKINFLYTSKKIVVFLWPGFWNLQIHYSTMFRSLAPNVTQFGQWVWKVCT